MCIDFFFSYKLCLTAVTKARGIISCFRWVSFHVFTEQKHTLLLIFSEQSDRGGALWRAIAARLRPARDHCYPSSGGLSTEPGRSGSPRPVKNNTIATSHEPARWFFAAEGTPEFATGKGLGQKGKEGDHRPRGSCPPRRPASPLE